MKISVCLDGMGSRKAPIPCALIVKIRDGWKQASASVHKVLSDRKDKEEEWATSLAGEANIDVVIVAIVD